MIQKSICTFLAAFFCSVAMMAATPYFHEVKPTKGQGIYALMNKYDLNIHPCNLEKFLKINGLSKKSVLHTHKSYKLPIYIYSYNGKSIRSTIGVDDWEKAVRIKKFNEKIKSKGLRRTNYIDSKILWVPYHEVECTGTQINMEEAVSSSTNNAPTASTTSSSSKVVTEKLFGEKYGKVNILDNTLKGQVYYVISGHGGPDPGAQCIKCPKTMCEDEYAYDIALRLARDLMQHGAKVHVIIQDANDGIRDEKYLKCDYEEKCLGKYKMPAKPKARLVQRSAEINKLYRSYLKKGISDANQTAIFIHVDSNGKSKKQDVYFYHKKKSKAGKKLANKVRDTFDRKYAKYQKNRGYKGTVKTRGLFVLNYTQATSIFVELANIQNKSDHERLIRKENRQAVANWLFEGVTH